MSDENIKCIIFFNVCFGRTVLHNCGGQRLEMVH